MKLQEFGRELMCDNNNNNNVSSPSLSISLGCKHLCPLAPKLVHASTIATSPPSSFDLKSFIKPESTISPTKHGSSPDNNNNAKKDPPQATETTHPGGTRWNPTQEQIGILEMLYKGGVRTPNARQIEQITVQLSKFGKIEGKNVFYWFQNHKARERQKMKRNNTTASLGLVNNNHSPTTPLSSSLSPPTQFTLDRPIMVEVDRNEEISGNKRKCRSWVFEFMELEEKKTSSSCCRREDNTLELFPLHPDELGMR